MESTRCPACGAEVAAGSRFCATCGAHLGASAVVTAPPGARSVRLQADSGYPAHAGVHEGRFPVGIILGERYRILGLLGRGGMGEVYRAHDLKLEQQVALKFLPEAAVFNPSLMERFRGEVRVARQISHRNVCRVYDLGEANGAPFISMEYVDGEDLASLLRRIGRLPGDKALEFARRLCAGLAAAHEKGILHRDLKPANIMIDGRGQLLIMDFGLAAVADAITGHDIRSGTPAYMAPEQRDGREVTVRSDIYALGIVLAEMFSGSRPAADGRLTTTSKDVDPAIEQVIQGCVDPTPAKRFASALDVARALPGGDPLAEALAAGETPSPAMVAASEDTKALSVKAAVACFALVVIALAAAIVQRDRVSVLRAIQMPNPPDVLEHKARDVAARFGYAEPAMDEATGFTVDEAYASYAESNWTRQQYRARLANGSPRLLGFWYRRSPRPLFPSGGMWVRPEDPPENIAGMVRVELDPRGRLYSFAAVPPEAEASAGGPFDWNELFLAAGLDRMRFQPAIPQWVPRVSFDARAAWTGTIDGTPAVPVRLEAASWKGRPVYFHIIWPWMRPSREVPSIVAPGQRVGPWLSIGVLAAVSLTAGLLAWRHYRLQRGDLRGSVRVGAIATTFIFLANIAVAHHVAGFEEVQLLVNATRGSVFGGLVLCGLYMALEPYVRRRWPQGLITWTRLLDGNVRDPLVCAQALVGIALGMISFHVIGMAVLMGGGRVALEWPSPGTLEGVRQTVGIALYSVVVTVLVSLFVFFLVFLARAVLRRDWLAAVVVLSLVALISRAPDLFSLVATIVLAAFGLWVLLRFGLLPLVAAAFVHLTLLRFPITSDFSAWYSGASLMALGIILTLSVWSFRHALGGRRLFKTDLLEV